MPCYDGGPTREEIEEDERKKLQPYLDKIDTLTDLLCKAGKAWYGREVPSIELLKWWDQHKKWDAERGEPW